ncbi:hypothetical protein TELCIR_13631, partial [Teladorsagia circumcincta]
ALALSVQSKAHKQSLLDFIPMKHLRQPSYPCPTYEHVREDENREFYKKFDGDNEKWYNHLRQPSYPCPTYEHVREDENREFYKKFDGENEKWYNVLEKHTGIIPVDRHAISMLHGIHDEILHGQPQPDWINEAHDGITVIEWIREAHRRLALSKFNSPTKARLTAGVLLNDWIEALIGIAHHTLDTRRAIFSSVGTNLLLAMRYAMGIADDELPGPGSLLLLELRTPNGQNRVVELFTRNSTGQLFQRRLPTCEHRCPMDKFLTELRPMRLTVEDLDMVREGLHDRITTTKT